jgi:hypothetical protein
MKVAGALLLLALAACNDEKPQPRTVPLSEAPEARGGVRDAGSRSTAPPPPEAMSEEPDAGGEMELPPGKVWLSVPGLGVDVAVAPEVQILKKGARGGEIVLTDGRSDGDVHIKRGAAGQSVSAIKAKLTAEGGGKLGVVVDRAEGQEFRLEYVIKDRKSGAPIFGLAMRRVIDGKLVDCTSRGPDTGSTRMAFDACRVMRATP